VGVGLHLAVACFGCILKLNEWLSMNQDERKNERGQRKEKKGKGEKEME
jgi:hypothetical protein